MSRWKQGDTLPPMKIFCFDDKDKAPDLTHATQVKVRIGRKGLLVWERVVSGAADGTIVVPLQTGDTATVGKFTVKVVVTWPGGEIQHYPPADEYLTMTVTR